MGFFRRASCLLHFTASLYLSIYKGQDLCVMRILGRALKQLHMFECVLKYRCVMLILN